MHIIEETGGFHVWHRNYVLFVHHDRVLWSLVSISGLKVPIPGFEHTKRVNACL